MRHLFGIVYLLVVTTRERLTYEDFGRATRELAQQICDSGYAPDIVLSIARGGFFLGAGLGYALGVKNAFMMSVESCPRCRTGSISPERSCSSPTTWRTPATP